MTKESPMPAAEPMSQEIVERLKELLAKATPGPWFSSRYRRALGSQVWAGKPGPGVILICGDGDAEDVDADLIVFLRNNADALLSTLTNLTPSGVERVGQLIEDMLGQRGGICVPSSVCNAVASDILAALALPSEPPSQGDVEGRARELAAFTQSNGFDRFTWRGTIQTNGEEPERFEVVCRLASKEDGRS